MIESVLLITGVLALAGCLAELISQRSRIPRVALLLLMGLLLGRIPGADVLLAALRTRLDVVAEAILVVVLFYGGLSIDIEDLGEVLLPGVLLASVGALLTALVVGFSLFAAIGSGLFDLPGWGLLLSVTFGALIAPNDPIAVFSAIEVTGGGKRADTVAKFEAGFDDTMVTTLVLMVFLPMLLAGEQLVERLGTGVLYFLRLSAMAVVVGYLAGLAGSRLIGWVRDRLVRTLLSLALVSATFLAGRMVVASGYVAVFILGLVLARQFLGHSRKTYEGLSEHWEAVFRVGETTAFVALGALVDVAQLPWILPVALFVVGTLVLLARPWSVVFCTAHTDLALAEKLYIAAVALKGLDPAVLSIAVVSALGAHQELIDLTFSVVMLMTVVQSAILSLLFRFGLFRETEAAAVSPAPAEV